MSELKALCGVGGQRRLRRQRLAEDGKILSVGTILLVERFEHENHSGLTIRYFMRAPGSESTIQMTQRTLKADTRCVE